VGTLNGDKMKIPLHKSADQDGTWVVADDRGPPGKASQRGACTFRPVSEEAEANARRGEPSDALGGHSFERLTGEAGDLSVLAVGQGNQRVALAGGRRAQLA